MSLIQKFFKRLNYSVDIIAQYVRWYLAYSLSLRNLEDMMAQRGIIVDQFTLLRWVIRLVLLQIKPSGGINAPPVAGCEWMKRISKSRGNRNICTGRLILKSDHRLFADG